tara:strand:+ start:3414 stop:3974 length:561 start_codon:yes stop_codon:yes gene_type:complete
MSKVGELNIIMGPMYSGKSTELLRIYNKFKRNYNILVINHKCDNRYGTNSVNTHNKDSIDSVSVDNLFDSINESNLEEIDIILIDESQFFDNLYIFCKEFVENYNKIIYVFGLSGDSNRGKFGEILDLIPIADNVTLLKSICNCCKNVTNAPFTLRKNRTINQLLVGSSNEYMAVCRSCWLKHNFS